MCFSRFGGFFARAHHGEAWQLPVLWSGVVLSHLADFGNAALLWRDALAFGAARWGRRGLPWIGPSPPSRRARHLAYSPTARSLLLGLVSGSGIELITHKCALSA